MNLVFTLMILLYFYLFSIKSTTAQDDIKLSRLLGKCQFGTHYFDECIKYAFNELTAFFTVGFPELNIRPFDPHHAAYIEQRRGNDVASYVLILQNVSEYGWAKSNVTKYKTDADGQRIIYSQEFPEKSLEGYYEFSGKLFGNEMKRKGFWNMTLYDYSQTTNVMRLGEFGSPLAVNIAIDRIGGLQMHISNLIAAGGRGHVDKLSDAVINGTWKLGLPFVKPLINDLISRAFTEIFNNSFRYFNFAKYIS